MKNLSDRARLPFLACVVLLALMAGPPVVSASEQTPDSTGPTADPVGHVPYGFAAVQADGTITFDEFALGTTIVDQYQAAGVRFSQLFPAFLTSDRSQPTSPVISGSPKFSGPIDFSVVDPNSGASSITNGVSFEVGYIDNRLSILVTTFDRFGNTLGSFRPNSLGINQVEIPLSGISRVRIEATEFEAQGFAVDNLRLNTVEVSEVQRVLVLGDSYTSGEGLLGDGGLRYDCGTDMVATKYYRDSNVPLAVGAVDRRAYCDTRTFNIGPSVLGAVVERELVNYENKCHRHGRAWGVQAAKALGATDNNLMFAACSGAVTANLGYDSRQFSLASYPRSPVNVHGGQLQSKTAQDWADEGGAPDLILIGIGGNDGGFSGIIEECLKRESCDEDVDFTRATINGINERVFPRLSRTFSTIRDTYPNATILAYGYPSVVTPDLDTCIGLRHPKYLLLGEIDRNERAWAANSVLPTLNLAIEDAASEAGVTYMPITQVTAGHEICSDSAYVNGIRLGDDKVVVGNESMHPNEFGHDAIADHFIDNYTDGNGRITFSNPEPQDNIRPPTQPIPLDIGSVAVTPQGECGADCVQPACSPEVCNLSIQLSGFAPNTPLQVQATPVLDNADNLTRKELVADSNVLTDANGRANVEFTLPLTVTGVVDVEVSGMSPAGTPQRGSRLVEVERESFTPTVDAADPFDGTVAEAETIDEILAATDYTIQDADTLRLYRAFLDREPDVAGAIYWIQTKRNGASLDDLAYGFAASVEFTNEYGTLGNAAFLNVLYANMLARLPDPDGFAYWLDLMDSGELTQYSVVRWVVANQEFVLRYPYAPTRP